jgi:hypothetical protein
MLWQKRVAETVRYIVWTSRKGQMLTDITLPPRDDKSQSFKNISESFWTQRGTFYTMSYITSRGGCQPVENV